MHTHAHTHAHLHTLQNKEVRKSALKPIRLLNLCNSQADPFKTETVFSAFVSRINLTRCLVCACISGGVPGQRQPPQVRAVRQALPEPVLRQDPLPERPPQDDAWLHSGRLLSRLPFQAEPGQAQLQPQPPPQDVVRGRVWVGQLR